MQWQFFLHTPKYEISQLGERFNSSTRDRLNYARLFSLLRSGEDSFL